MADPTSAQSASELAEQLRLLIDTLTSTQPPEPLLTELAQQVTAMNTALASEPRSRYWERGETGSAYGTYSPYRGTLNPVAPPMVFDPVDRVAGRIKASVVVPAVYEGPPQTVHGGMIAALFDEIMGAAQAHLLPARAGVTGRLEVRYRKPTPTNTPLRFSAWIDTDTARACRVRAECHHGETKTAQASALFVRSSGAS